MEIAFVGKRVLVTGASRGIGKGVAVRLAVHGAEVIAVATNLLDLELLKKQQPSIRILQCDCSNWETFGKVLRAIGDIDLCVNNAAISIPKPLEEIQQHDCEKVFAINVAAVIQSTQYVARSLKSRQIPGAIVNVSSVASKIGILDHAVYCASKGAVDAFTSAAAVELGPFGIRVNCINPTAILTDRGKEYWTDESRACHILDRIPLKRFAEVGEVVDAIVYLLSDKSAMITGCSLAVDGGSLAN